MPPIYGTLSRLIKIPLSGEHSKLHGRRFFLDNNIPSVKIRREYSTIPGTDAAEAEALPDDTMDLTYS